MTKNGKIFVVCLVALVIGLLGAAWHSAVTPPANKLGEVNYQSMYFAGNVYSGPQSALMMQNGIEVGTIGGSAFATLQIATTTTLAPGFDCSYDTIQVQNTLALATVTLPTATQEDTCLTQDGSWELTEFANNSTNTVALATSTGDILAYNTSSTPSATLASSSAGTYYKLEAFRLNSSTIIFTLGYNGVGH